MTSISGTNVNAPIVPFDSNDNYPSHIDIYGKGGFRTVSTLIERDNIASNRKVEGMQVYVIEDKKIYILQSDLTTWYEDTLSQVIFYQNTIPNTISINNIWINSNTGIQYYYLSSNNQNIFVQINQ